MRCTSDGQLRALIDGEASETRLAELERHVAQCPKCQQRLDAMTGMRGWIEGRMTALSRGYTASTRASATEAMREPIPTLAYKKPSFRRAMLMNDGARRAWRPVVLVIAVLSLLVGTYSFPPTRAIARELLSVFRVRKFAVIQIQPDESQIEQIGRTLEDSLFAQEPKALLDEPQKVVASIEEASQAAGFEVRMPSYWPTGDAVSTIAVKGRTEIEFSVTREGIVTLLELAEMDPADIPDGWVEAAVHASVSSVVSLSDDTIEMRQIYKPQVEYPQGIDPSIIGEAGLRLMGIAPAEAHSISSAIDWANTLVIPVPASIASVQELEVAGHHAVLLTPQKDAEDARRTLTWEDGEVVYVIGARNTSTERIVQIAASMY